MSYCATSKQRDILLKHVSDDYIKKLERLGFDTVSSFINLIFNTNGYYGFYGEKVDDKLDEYYLSYINSKISNYSKITDEKFHNYKSYKFLNTDVIIYQLQQKWFKGESNSPSTVTISVDYRASKFRIYEKLIDLEVYSVCKLMDLILKRGE